MYFVEGLLEDRESKNCFALEIRGNGLADSGIISGDKAVVRRQGVVNDGEIAVILIGDKIHCGRFLKEEKRDKAERLLQYASI